MNNALGTVYFSSVFAAAVAYLSMAVLVVVLGRKSTLAALWAAVCVSLSVLWFNIALPSTLLVSESATLLATRLGFTGGTASSFFCLAFSLGIAGLFNRRQPLLYVSGGLAVALLLLFWFTEILFSGMTRSAYGVMVPVPGPLMPVYGVYCLASGAASVFFIVRQYRRSTGHARLQVRYVLVAMAILATAAIGSLLLPLERESPVVLVPSMLMIIAPTIITYAIIKHRLWDIRTVIHKTVLWVAASLIVVVPVYFAVRYLGPTMKLQTSSVALVGALVLFGAFALHFRVVQPWIDHLFARRRHDPAKVVDVFNKEVVNLRGVRDLWKLVRQTLESTVYVADVRMHVARKQQGELTEVEGGAVFPLTPGMRRWLVTYDQVVDVSLLEAKGPRSDDERALIEHCQQRKIEVLLPLIDEMRLLGVVELGEKQNLRAYTRDDFVLLERVRAPATVAVANARLYDQLQDLTVSLERRVEQRTHELREANEKLKEADRQKTKFFANITHELRTPLTMIVAPLEEMLLRQGKERELGDDLHTMHRNALRLLRLINGLLDLAKLDAGQLRLKPMPIRINRLVETTVRSFEPLARRKDVQLDLAPLEGDDTVFGDPEKLDLVLSNLLANAVKFTPGGGRVDVRVIADEEWITLAVRDTGIGIPDDQLERVFDRFAQVDGGPDRRYEGAGIGLSLVKEMVALHRGAIELASRLGEGSEFRVKLRRGLGAIPEYLRDRREVDVPTEHARRAEDRDPVGWVPAFEMDGETWVTVKTESDDAARDARPRPRVMVVEDNPDMRTYLSRRLQKKYDLELCPDGKEALRRIAERPPDLVVSDVMMPEISGDELCRRLKADPATSSIPVVLITARKGVDRTLEGFKAGADDYLTKPFNIQELLARVEVQLRLQEMGRKLAQHEKAATMNLVAAGLAHEVRNPVNAILNAVKPLLEGQLVQSHTPEAQEARQELLAAILDSAERIDRLCGDLLGVARPHLDENADWQVEEAVESALRLIRHRRGVEPTVVRSVERDAPVFGRTAELNQVLLNLLDNAVRAAGPEGRIEVRAEQRNGTFRLRVKDSGPGIPAGKEEQIFDPLFTLHGREGASGLGLHICRRIIEEHRGKIFARNVPGGGAELIVELPQGTQSADHQQHQRHQR
jgi:signal transduction histidine kinase